MTNAVVIARPPRRKISASGLGTFLRSPKSFYWRYIANLEPIQPSVITYDHDKLAGVVWAEFVDRFYQGINEATNTKQMLADWNEQTDGWVPEKAKERLTKALESWAATYYQMFNPKDGCRLPDKSELKVENDRFLGYLDGLGEGDIIHEVKSTSRSPQLAGQLWKVQNSIQVKLYAVLTKANGAVIEFAWKDTPYQIFRAPAILFTEEQRQGWEQELNALADYITSLGDDIHNYVCNPDQCCLVTKGVTSMCQYEALCDMGFNKATGIAYKTKERRK